MTTTVDWDVWARQCWEAHRAALVHNEDQRNALACCKKCPRCFSAEITISFENREQFKYTCKDCKLQFNWYYRGLGNNCGVEYKAIVGRGWHNAWVQGRLEKDAKDDS